MTPRSLLASCARTLAAAAAAWVLLAPGIAWAQSCAAPGILGPGTLNGTVNTYYAGSSPVAPAGATTIGVGAIDPRGAATPIAAGDLLLIVQVQDASISTSNSASYGGSGLGRGHTSLNSAGQYEYAVATGPAGGSVPLAAPLVNTYRSAGANSGQGQRRYQVIRVPQYSSATVTGAVNAPTWNGATGGVVAFDVAGALNWGGQTINVDGRGFRGGGGQCSSSNATGSATANTDYVSAVGTGTLTLGAGGGSVPNGAKGEGVAGTPILVFEPTTAFSNAAGTTVNTGGTDGTSGGYPGGSFGRGAPGNGGGGGTDGNTPANDQNTGGAGGGNYAIGGKGGFGWTPAIPPGVDAGGFGGMSVPGGAARLFMGGGGGSASSNNCTGTPAGAQASSGAAGGGLVFVRAGSTTGAITVNARGTSANSTITNDASGGGGAGGSVLIFVNNGGAGVGATINVQGGNGGSNTGGGSPHGPGGGGSGGFAIMSGSATVNVAGGVGGTTAASATSTADYGSTASSGGFQIVNLSASSIPGANGTSACFPQLTVTKSTSTPYVAAGTPATWTITVTNAANRGAATGVTLTDVLPANPNITYLSTSAVALAGGATRPTTTDPAVAATSPAWSAFTIPGGGSVALTFLANTNASVATGVYQNPATVTYLDPTRTAAQTVTPGGTYTAGGTVLGSNYNPASTTNEDVTVLNPPPTITKSFAPASINVGATSVLTTVINNATPVNLTGVGVTDTYPAGMVNSAAPNGTSSCGGTVSAAPGGTGFVLAGASLAAAASCTVTVNVTITATGSYVNTIPAGGLTGTQGITNTAAATATLYSNVTVAKSFSPAAVPPNSDATLSLILTNPNTLALTLANPGLTDTFPVGLVATGGAVTVSGAGCTGFTPATVGAGATSFVLTAGNLPANASCTVQIAVRSATAGNYSNTASGVTTTAGTTGPASNTASLGVGLINITKAFLPTTIVQGGTSTITYTLTNPTGVLQTGGAFLDTMVNMAISATPAVGGTCTGTTPATFSPGDTNLNFTGITIPAAGCTVSVVVTSNVVGTLPNATNGVTTSILPQGPGSNNADLFVLARPSIAKAFSPAAVQPGATTTLTFTIGNTGPLGLSGMQFTDTYPVGLTNATPITVGGTCTGVAHTATAGGNTFNVTAGNIPANSSCTITVLIQTSVQGSFPNTASAVNTTQTGAGTTGSNTAILQVAGSPTVVKSFGTSPINQGGTSVITFLLANPNAGLALTNARFTDALVNMSVASATIGGTCAGTTSTPGLVVGATALDLTVPTLAVGSSCTVQITVTSSISGTHPNTTSGATSTQTPVAGGISNTASLVVPSPAALAKNFVPGAIQSGGSTSIVFTLTNNNATALTTVQFTDPLVNMALGAAPAVVETCGGTVSSTGIAALSTSFQLTLDSLAAGESCTITVSPVTSTIPSPATGHPNTTSTVSSVQTSVNRGTAATGNLLVYAPPTVTKSFAPNNVATSAISVITFTVTNPNALALSDIRFTDDLPTGLSNATAQTFVGGARGTCVAAIPTTKTAAALDPITWSNINLAAGASCTVMMDVSSGTAGVYTNTVTNILSDQTTTGVTGGSDTLAVGRINITKAFGAATLQVNGTTTMTFSLTNPGIGNNINNLTFTDTFPAGLQAVGGAVTYSAGCTGGTPATIAANATSFAVTDLDDLDNAETCTVSLQVRGTTAGAKANTVTGTGPATFTGSTDTATVTVYAAPTIAKAFTPSTIAAGATSTLTLTLANPNAFGVLAGAAFTDTLTNMSVAGAQTVGGTCAGTTPSALADGATALSFTGISIPAAGSCTVTLTVTSATAGTHPNTASGVTTTQTPTAGTNSGAVNLVVGGVNITKAFVPVTRPVNAPTRLTITLTSTQAVDWTGLAFTDTLPANLVIANPPNAATTCGAGTVGAVAGASVVTLSGATMASGGSPCSVALDVVSAVTGARTNNNTNFSALSTGLSAAGANATVTYTSGSSLTKAFAPASIAPGATSIATFTITNGAGAPAASGLAFVDTLPANVVVAPTPGVSSTCGGTVTAAAGTGSIALVGGNVGAAPATCTISVSVTSSVLGTYNNISGNVSGLAGGLSAATMNASLAVVGTSLTKSHTPATIGRNGVATMTFVIANGSGNPAQSGLGFIENLRANVFIAPTPNVANTCGGTVTAVAGAGTATLAGGAIAAGVGSCTWSVDVTSAVSGSYLNDASRVVNAPASMDTSGVNATLTVIENPTAAKAFGAATIASGGTTSLTLTFTNPNGAGLTGLAFTDTFPVAPGAMTLANVTTSNTCGGTLTDSGGGAIGVGDVGIRLTGGTLAAGGVCSVSVNVTAAVVGTYTNTLPPNTITTTNGGAVSTATTGTLQVLARPTITKAFGAASIPSGGVASLTVTLANTNAVPVTGAAFVDTLPLAPGAMTIANATTSNTCGGTLSDQAAGAIGVGDTGFQLSGGTIPAGSSCTVSVNVTASVAGAYANVIPVGGLTTTNGGANTVAANASLSVLAVPTATKAFAPGAIFPGATAVLTITLTNPNALPITGAAFTDTYPPGLTNTGTPAGATSCAGGAVNAAVSGTSVALSGGTIPASGSCTVTVNVTSNTVGIYNNTTGAITTADAGTAAAANGTLTVVGGMASTKLFSPINIAVGGLSTLTITLTNPNTTTAVNGIAFTDTYPAGVTNSATPGGATTCPGGSVTAGANGASLALSGATLAAGASCQVTVQVTSSTPGTHVNAVGNITAANAPSTAGDSTVLFVNGAPTVAKSFTPTSIGPGGTSALRLTLANPAGNPAAGMTGLSVSDPLGTFNLSVATPATVTFTPAACGTLQSRATVGAGAYGAVTAGHQEVSFTVASLPPGVSCQVDVNVTSTTPGAANNTTSTPAATGPVATTGTAANATLTVTQAALTKLFALATIDQGGISTLTFTLTNGAGNPAQSGITFTDTLPASVVVANTPNLASTCPGGTGVVTAVAASGTITVTGATMNAAQASCTISVDVTSNTPGTHTNNTSNIGTTQRVTTTGVNATLTVLARPTLTKAFAPATVGVAQNSVLTFTITNPAGAPARTGLTFTDTLPAGAIIGTPNGVTNNCGGAPTITATAATNTFTVAGTGVNAAAGPSSCTILVNVTSNTAGSYVNGAAQVTAISGLLNGVTNQTLTVTQATVTKAFTGPLTLGGTTTLVLTLANGAGNPAQAGIGFTDTLPAGLVVAGTPNFRSNCPAGGALLNNPAFLTAPGGVITVSGAAINAAVASCEIRVDVTTSGTPTVGACPQAANTNVNVGGLARVTNGVGAGVCVPVNPATPSLDKAFSGSLAVGGTTTLTFTITQPSGNPPQAFSFTDTLPAGLAVGAGANGGTCSGGTLTATAGSSVIQAAGRQVSGTSCTITVPVTTSATPTAVACPSADNTNATAAFSGLTNLQVAVSNSAAGGGTSGGGACVTVLARPTVAKVYAPNPVAAGGTTVLTITLSNANTAAVTGVAFTDTNPVGVLNTATPAGATTCGGTVTAAVNGTSVALSGGTIPASGSCTVTVNQAAAVAGTYMNTMAVGDVTSTNAGANAVAANDTLNVYGAPTIAKAFLPAAIGPGGTSTLTFTITNPAANVAPLTGVAFSDTFPIAPGSMLVSPTPAATTSGCGTPTFAPAANDPSISFSGASVAVGGTCTVSVNVTAPLPGTYNNTSGMVSATGPVALTGGTAAASLTVTQASLTKVFNAATIDQGGVSTLTFTLTNGAGSPAQSGIGFLDTLPGTVVVAPTPNLASSCPSGIGAITAAAGSGTITVANATMNAAQATCTISVDVTGNTPGTYNNVAANITAAQRVTTTGVNATLTIRALPTLTKAFLPTTVGVGSSSVLTFTITNPAGAPARTNLTFTDTLPAGAIVGTPNGVINSCGGAPTITATPGVGTFTVAGPGVNAAAGPSTCTIVVNVTSNTAGSYVNGAAQVSAISGLLNGVTNQTLTVTQAALTKVFAPSAIDQGGVSTLTFTITNGAGNPAQAGIAFIDTLPTNVVVAPTPAIASTCPSGTGVVTAAAGGTTINVNGATLGNAMVSCTVSVNVTSNIPGAYNNTNGNLSGVARVGVTGVNATLTVSALPVLTKAFLPTTVGVGSNSVLTFTITNPAGAPARTNLTFADTLPVGAIVGTPNGVTNSCGGAPTITPGPGIFTIGGTGVNAAAGPSTCTIVVNVTSNTAGSYVNGAARITAISGMQNGVTNQTLTVTQAALTKVFAPVAIDQGGVSTLTFTLTNGAGNPAQAGINFIDTLPANVVVAPAPNLASSCPSGTGAITAPAGSLTITVANASMNAAQASCTISVDVTSSIPGVYNNTNGNLSGVARVGIAGVNATLTVSALPSLTKAFVPTTVGVGSNSVLTFTITNPAGAPARSNLTFADTLPAGAIIGTPNGVINSCGGTPTITATPGPGIFTVGGTGVNAAAGPSTCTIVVHVTSNTAGSYVNGAAQVSAISGMLNAVTNQTLTVTQAALTKAFAPAAIDQGGVSTLTFTITNGAGNPAQAGINFTDTLPASVVVAPTPNLASSCPSGPGAITAPAGSLTITVANASMNAAQASCTVSVDVTSNVPGSYNNTSTNISGAARVTTTGVNATLTVQAQVSLTKAFGAAAIGIGQTTTLTFTIPNTGTNAVNRTGISFTDTLPAGLPIANPPVPTSSVNCGAPAFTAADGTLPFTAANISVNAGQTCTITLTVRGATLGTKTNNAASITALSGVLNGVTPQSVDVVQASLDKAFSPTTIAAGSTSTLTFTLTNAAGNPAQSGIGFTDNLPGNVRVAAVPNALTNCPAGGGSFGPPSFTVTAPAAAAAITVAGATMNAATTTCQVRVDVTAAIGGAYTNNAASVIGVVNVTNAVNPSTLTVTAPAPTVGKTFTPSTVNVNTTSTLTLTFTNANTAVATLTSALVDPLPGSVVVAPTPNASTTCVGAGAIGAVAGSSTVTVPAGRAIPAAVGAVPGSCTVVVDVVSAFGGSFTNTIAAGALQTSNGSNAAPATAVLTVNAAAPTIAKAFAPATIAADGTSTVTFTITNPNAFQLTSAAFTDTLVAMGVSANQAAAGTCTGAGTNNFTAAQSGLLNFSGLTIPAAVGTTAGSCTVTFIVASDVPGPHNNQATAVTSTQAPTGAASNVAVLTVTGAPATIAKAFGPASIAYGGTSTVTLTLANTNGSPLTGAAFGDTLANMSVATNQAAGGTCTGAGSNNFTAGQAGLAFSGITIPANGSCTVTFTVTGLTPGTHPNATTAVSSNEAATGAVSNTATLTVTVLEPTVTKQFTPAAIASGGTSTLQVTITNPNGAPITGVGLTDTFPTTPGTGVLRAATPSASAGASCGAATVGSTVGSVTLSDATIAAGASCTFQINVTAATQGSYLNAIAVGALASSAGTNTAGANATLSVTPVADVAITKLGPATIGTGAPISYTLSITNLGPDAATGTTFSDTVPAQVTGVTAGCVAGGGADCGTFGVAGNVVSATFPALPMGATLSITINGTVSGLGSMTNTATVAVPGGITDPAAANNSSSVTTTILAPDLTLAKSHVGNFTVGVNGTYTLTVTNQPGSLTTTGVITVTDTLPAGLGFVSATGTGWACGFAAPTVTCTANAAIVAGASSNPITLVVSVASIAVPAVTNSATVSGGGEPAGLIGNNTASDYTLVVSAAVNTFAPDGAQTGMPGSVLFYPHTFTAGSAGSVTFSTTSIQSPVVPGWNQSIYHDADCSATLNGAEGAATLAAPIVLAAGQTACIIVRDAIPGTAPYNAQNAISVISTFNGSSTITRTDLTTVGAAAGAGLTLAKAVRNVTQGGASGTSGTALPNDVLEYTITFTNPSPSTVTAIVVTDATPAFTLYLSAACTLPLPGNLSGCSVTSQPAVNGTGSVVWTLTGALLSGGSGSVTYQVRVTP